MRSHPLRLAQPLLLLTGFTISVAQPLLLLTAFTSGDFSYDEQPSAPPSPPYAPDPLLPPPPPPLPPLNPQNEDGCTLYGDCYMSIRKCHSSEVIDLVNWTYTASGLDPTAAPNTLYRPDCSSVPRPVHSHGRYVGKELVYDHLGSGIIESITKFGLKITTEMGFLLNASLDCCVMCALTDGCTRFSYPLGSQTIALSEDSLTSHQDCHLYGEESTFVANETWRSRDMLVRSNPLTVDLTFNFSRPVFANMSGIDLHYMIYPPNRGFRSSDGDNFLSSMHSLCTTFTDFEETTTCAATADGTDKVFNMSQQSSDTWAGVMQISTSCPFDVGINRVSLGVGPDFHEVLLTMRLLSLVIKRMVDHLGEDTIVDLIMDASVIWKPYLPHVSLVPFFNASITLHEESVRHWMRDLVLGNTALDLRMDLRFIDACASPPEALSCFSTFFSSHPDAPAISEDGSHSSSSPSTPASNSLGCPDVTQGLPSSAIVNVSDTLSLTEALQRDDQPCPWEISLQPGEYLLEKVLRISQRELTLRGPASDTSVGKAIITPNCDTWWSCLYVTNRSRVHLVNLEFRGLEHYLPDPLPLEVEKASSGTDITAAEQSWLFSSYYDVGMLLGVRNPWSSWNGIVTAIESSQLTITGCVFFRLQAFTPLVSALGYSQVAVYDSRFEGNVGVLWAFLRTALNNITIVDTTFIRNVYVGGNGVVHSERSGLPMEGTSFLLERCEFIDNRATQHGAGALSVGRGVVVIRDCLFQANHAEGPGGAMLIEASFDDITIENTRWINNAAGFKGGAIAHETQDTNIFFASIRSSARMSLKIINNTFVGNSAVDGGGAMTVGYGIAATWVHLEVVGSHFIENRAGGGQTGALGYGGGVSYFTSRTMTETCDGRDTNGTLIFRDSTFVSNSASKGGAGEFSSTLFDAHDELVSLRFENCTFRNNSVSQSGGALKVSLSNVSISESTFADNFAVESGGTIDAHGPPGFPKGLNITNCTQPNQAGYLGDTMSEYYPPCKFQSPARAAFIVPAQLDIYGSTFSTKKSSNSTPNGGVLAITNYNVTLDSCVLRVSPTAPSSLSSGTAIYAEEGSASLYLTRTHITQEAPGHGQSGTALLSFRSAGIMHLGSETVLLVGDKDTGLHVTQASAIRINGSRISCNRGQELIMNPPLTNMRMSAFGFELTKATLPESNKTKGLPEHDECCPPEIIRGSPNCSCVSVCSNCPNMPYKPEVEISMISVSCAECPPGTYQNSTPVVTDPQQQTEQCIPCEVGKYASESGSISCLPCQVGQVATSVGATHCRSCTGGKYAESASQCDACTDTNAIPDVDGSSCHCRPNYYKDDSGCTACPPESGCYRDTTIAQLGDSDGQSNRSKFTLATLHIKQNFWRLSNRTKDIRPCLKDSSGKTSSCAGGSEVGHYCRSNTTGVLCQACEAGDFYDSVRSSCLACPPTGGAVAFGLFTFAACVAAAALVLRALQSQKSPLRPALIDMSNFAARIGLQGKLKLIIGFYQVVISMPTVFDLHSSLYFKHEMHIYYILSFEWLTNALVPRECIGPFKDRLFIEAFLPLILVGAWALAQTIYFGLSGGGAEGPNMQHKPLELVLSKMQKERSSANFAAIRQLTRSVRWMKGKGSKRGDASLEGGGCARLRHAWWAGWTRSLPLSLLLIFLCLPAISRLSFAAYPCDSFGYDDAKNIKHEYLHADYSVRCKGEEYQTIIRRSVVVICCWPVGMLFTFGALLFACRHEILRGTPSVLSHATKFLWMEYTRSCFWWELLELSRKLVLSGGLMVLVPQTHAFERLVIAVLMSIGYIILLQAVHPFRLRSTAVLSLTLNVCVVAVLLVALLIKISTVTSADAKAEQQFFGSSQGDADVLIRWILSFNGLVILFVFAQLADEFRRDRTRRTLRIKSTGQEPELGLRRDEKYLLFLSHNWANQDVVATIKRQLQLLLPSVSIFLDIDNLANISDLEKEIAASSAVLILLGSTKYFRSPNCKREVDRAMLLNKPLVLVHESDPSKNGAALEELKAVCRDTWGQRYVEFIWAAGAEDNGSSDLIIPWHRGKDFQDVSLRSIAERALLSSPWYERLDEQGNQLEGQRLPLMLPRSLSSLVPSFSRCTRLYVSDANGPSAQAVARELERLCGSSSHFRLVSELDDATHMLLYLSEQTFDLPQAEQGQSSGLGGAGGGAPGGGTARGLQAELLKVLQPPEGCEPPQLVLVQQKPGEFEDIKRATPKELLDLKVFDSIAVPWEPPEARGLDDYRQVSLRLIAQNLGASFDVGGGFSAAAALVRGSIKLRGSMHDAVASRAIVQPTVPLGEETEHSLFANQVSRSSRWGWRRWSKLGKKRGALHGGGDGEEDNRRKAIELSDVKSWK